MAATAISGRQFEIIEAAGRILSTSGVNGLTIKNLAQEMKFSESAIYRHFASKEEIVVAMLGYLAENMDERLQKVTSAHNKPAEKLEAIFLDQIAFFSKNPHFVVAVFFGWSHGSKPKNQCSYSSHHASKNETFDAHHRGGATTRTFHQCHYDRRIDAHRHGQFSLANVQMAHRQFPV